MKPSDYKAMLWKNGQGQTLEIDRFPETDDRFLWRLSQATIQVDGPFSAYQGYDRWLMVWKGPGLFLNQERLGPLQPFHFSGDSESSYRLIGTQVEDIGLIYDRTKITAQMSLVSGEIFVAPKGLQAVNYLFDLHTGETRRFVEAIRLQVVQSLLISCRLRSRQEKIE